MPFHAFTDATSNRYRRLLVKLAWRAKRLGARDAEGAAQESLRRSLESPDSRCAIEYYFSEDLESRSTTTSWQLNQLSAWLHGVLQFVVLEEHNRASNQREISFSVIADRGTLSTGCHDPIDPSTGQLDTLIEGELERIVFECLPCLEPSYQQVLKMRASGLKYGEIARHLHISENTVATWVSRAIRSLRHQVRKRTLRHQSRTFSEQHSSSKFFHNSLS